MRRKNLIPMLLALTLLLTGCTATAETRTGTANGYGGPLTVEVKMDGETIKEVRVVSHNETPGVGTRAIDTMPGAIKQAGNADVEGVSGATLTSNAIREAVRQATGMMGGTMDMNSTEATQAPGLLEGIRSGIGMAATGSSRTETEGSDPVYGLNIAVAAVLFDENDRILHVDVDQMTIASQNALEGNTFPGFPEAESGLADFMNRAEKWMTKGAMGDDYKMPSGSWRSQMDVYQSYLVGKTMDEVMAWYEKSFDPETGRPKDTEAITGATMSLVGSHGNIMLALERAWEDAQGESAMTEAAPEATQQLAPAENVNSDGAAI